MCESLSSALEEIFKIPSISTNTCINPPNTRTPGCIDESLKIPDCFATHYNFGYGGCPHRPLELHTQVPLNVPTNKSLVDSHQGSLGLLEKCATTNIRKGEFSIDWKPWIIELVPRLEKRSTKTHPCITETAVQDTATAMPVCWKLVVKGPRAIEGTRAVVSRPASYSPTFTYIFVDPLLLHFKVMQARKVSRAALLTTACAHCHRGKCGNVICVYIVKVASSSNAGAGKCKAIDVATKFEIVKACEEGSVGKTEVGSCWLAGFLGDLPFPHPFIPALLHMSITLIGSQDLNFEEQPTSLHSLTFTVGNTDLIFVLPLIHFERLLYQAWFFVMAVWASGALLLLSKHEFSALATEEEQRSEMILIMTFIKKDIILPMNKSLRRWTSGGQHRLRFSSRRTLRPSFCSSRDTGKQLPTRCSGQRVISSLAC
ncbi:hypothetical protein PR048_025891 [Dryococelus australis]|uniref:Uncharacterized protein n=1 Tax=Dryococelus australis TaxID=614101 RepID=A0ABQ9GJW0_9NEOP|nr:hypothetical protein PR048_025891 [Dryococelus australis]